MDIIIRKQLLCFLAIIFCLLLINIGCSKKNYSGKWFSYPPNSKPHEDSWEYRGSIIITQKEKGSFTKKTHKTIQINIKDREKTEYLDDVIQIYCAGIDAVIEWGHFEKLDISLLEVGNKYEDDDYNMQLLKKGPNKLTQLKYTYDSSLRKFVRLKNGSLTN